MTDQTVYVAKESFAVEIDGVPTLIHKGQTRVRAGHPLLKGRANLFEPIKVQYDIEQATSAPGEQRSVRVAASAPEAPAPAAPAPAAPAPAAPAPRGGLKTTDLR